MACANIGEANADIAGIGVVTAFAFQAIASWVLSGILDVMLPDPLDHGSLRTTRPVRRSLFSLASLRDEIQKIEHDLAHPTRQVEDKAQRFRQLSSILVALREDARRYLQDLTETNRSQEVPQSLVLENIYERSPRQEARSVVAEILYTSSDTQTLAGIALALIGIVRQASLSLYQFHLIYDTINLTSISNCAALASASGVDTSGLLSRVLLMVVFGFLYLVFAILFGVHLGQWDDNVPGRCYRTRDLALSAAHHPYVDKIYLGITCLYMFSMLFFAWALAISRCKADPAWGRRRSALVAQVIKSCSVYMRIWDRSSQFIPLGDWTNQHGLKSVIWYLLKVPVALPQANPVLTLAMLQLPLHLYFIIRLRLSNEPLLSNGSDENDWGFGQIYALIMSAGLVVDCCKGYLRYWNANRNFKNRDRIDAKSKDNTLILH